MAYLQSKETDTTVTQKIKQLQNKYDKILLSLVVWDYNSQKKYVLLQHAKNKLSSYKIIYDPNYKLKVNQLNDEYYCNTVNDLNTIIHYILENSDLFVYNNTEDVLDHQSLIDYTDNFDNFTGNDIDF